MHSSSPHERRRRRAGVTLVELVVVVGVIGVLAAAATPMMRSWGGNQRVRSSTRAVADALLLARAEAIRTGNVHLVVTQQALGAANPVVIVNDGSQATSNCAIDPGEIRHRVLAETGVFWGTSPDLAANVPAPTDSGGALANVSNGSSFTDASLNPGNVASWVLFQPDGIPRLFTPNLGLGTCDDVGLIGQGGGAIYLTNGTRDYAAVLSPLGTVAVNAWDPSTGAWR